jgi:hypothetical protein
MSDVTKNLIKFALRNSNLPNKAIENESMIDNEIARNANKLSLSSNPEEAKSGKSLLKFSCHDGNKTSEALIEYKSDLAKKNRGKRTAKEGYKFIKELIIAEWKSGKYKYKKDCAEANYRNYGIAYETAIDYLKIIS